MFLFLDVRGMTFSTKAVDVFVDVDGDRFGSLGQFKLFIIKMESVDDLFFPTEMMQCLVLA